MRWLVLLGVMGSVACTRLNPSYGDSGGTERGDDDDGSGPSDDAIADEGVSIGEDAEASAEQGTSLEGQSDEDTAADTGASRSCCLAHTHGGCDEPTIEECVCSLGPSCCEVEWDESCAGKAQSACRAECGTLEGPFDTSDTMSGEESTTSGEGSTSHGSATATSDGESDTGTMSSCCEMQLGPGCDNPTLEDCVCVTNGMKACCVNQWTTDCADAFVSCGGRCP